MTDPSPSPGSRASLGPSEAAGSTPPPPTSRATSPLVRPASFSAPGSPFRPLGETLIHAGAVVSFYEGEFEGPSGSFTRDIVRHPGAVSAVAIEDGEVFLVRQYRAPLGIDLWEIPAGKRDQADEDPEDAVARELAEEIGRVPGTLEKLLSFHHSAGFCDELQFIYLATDLRVVPRQTDGPEEAEMLVERVPLAMAIEMALDGTITDGKSIAGILAAGRRLGA